MKGLLLFLSLGLSAASMACSTYEAQFSSVIKEVLAIEGEPYACWLKLDVNLGHAGQSYRPHQLCPLDIEEVYHGRIYSQHCDYQPGDDISGYIVKNSDGILELDI